MKFIVWRKNKLLFWLLNFSLCEWECCLIMRFQINFQHDGGKLLLNKEIFYRQRNYHFAWRNSNSHSLHSSSIFIIPITFISMKGKHYFSSFKMRWKEFFCLQTFSFSLFCNYSYFYVFNLYRRDSLKDCIQNTCSRKQTFSISFVAFTAAVCSFTFLQYSHKSIFICAL